MNDDDAERAASRLAELDDALATVKARAARLHAWATTIIGCAAAVALIAWALRQ